MRKLCLVIKIVSIILLLLFCINRFLIINIHVPTSSMENTIKADDKLIGSRVSSIMGNIKRFDIVVARDPFDKDKLIVKRIVGLPGEKVEIKNSNIYINDSEIPLSENFLKDNWIENNDGYLYKIPENHFLMLGDNRNDSFDARFWAEEAKKEGILDWEKYSYIDKKDIVAKIVFRYYHGFKLF